MSHSADCIICGMDRAALVRLRDWLGRPDVAAVDPERVSALAEALTAPDPPATAGRWGAVIGYAPGPGRRRLLQFDRHGHLVAALRWAPSGALEWAKCLTAAGQWIGIEPQAATHPVWGRSDRVWLLESGAPWAPGRALTVFQSLDYERPDFIPPLYEPRQLPPGAGTAILNLLAGLMKDRGLTGVRYRGPYPTEQLFTALLESFRYDPAATAPLEQFMASDLAWTPAPHERLFSPAGPYVQLRDGIEKVAFRGRAYYRQRWQGVVRAEPRVVRTEGARVFCSLWALGEPIEDHLILDPTGEILALLPPAVPEGTAVPLSPGWRSAMGEFIAHGSTPLLRPSILGVVERLRLEWGPVTGDLLEAAGDRLVVSLRLPRLFRQRLHAQPDRTEQVRAALDFAVEVARLLGPAVRRKAQAALAALPEAGQRAALELAEATFDAAGSGLQSSLDRLIRSLLAGRELPD